MGNSLLVLHLIGVAIWLGGNVGARLRRARAPPRRRRTCGSGGRRPRVRWPGCSTTSPASWCWSPEWPWCSTTRFEFSDTFVTIGFVAVILGAVLGMAVFGPGSRKLAAAIESATSPRRRRSQPARRVRADRHAGRRVHHRRDGRALGPGLGSAQLARTRSAGRRETTIDRAEEALRTDLGLGRPATRCRTGTTTRSSASSCTGGCTRCPAGPRRWPTSRSCCTTTGPRAMLRDNPYAEWYLNSMQIPGSPTQEHHARMPTAPTRPTTTSVTPFDDGSAAADLDALAGESADAGAELRRADHQAPRRLRPVARRRPHPRKGRYHAGRDLVGDLTEAVRCARHAHGPVLLGRVRLAVQRRGHVQPGRRDARRADRPRLPPSTSPRTSAS